MSSLLQVDKLSVCFGGGGFLGLGGRITAVSEVSLQVSAGETYALVGESGSGKTTLVRAIAGLLPIADGSVFFDGKRLTGMGENEKRHLRRQFSMMFQNPVGSLSPRFSVGTIITEPYKIHNLKKRDMEAEAKRLLDMVGLGVDFVNRFPHQLSGGQARRVGVARALALEPKLILADEPTAGLDVSVQGGLLNLLNNLREKLGLAILIITHNLGIVRHIADRVGVMYLGRIVEEASADELFLKPRHPYTLCLLSARARIGERQMQLIGEPPAIAHRPSGCEFRPRCPQAEKLCEKTPDWRMSDNHGVRCLKPF